MALYLFVIHPGLYKQATSALWAAGKPIDAANYSYYKSIRLTENSVIKPS
jgi:hypothetical protein